MADRNFPIVADGRGGCGWSQIRRRDVVRSFAPGFRLNIPSTLNCQLSETQRHRRIAKVSRKNFALEVQYSIHCYPFLVVSAKFVTCTGVSVNGTLVEAKLCTFALECTHFIFNLCPIYTNDGASAIFSTNSQETDYSVPEIDT